MTIVTNPSKVGRAAILRRNPTIVNRLLFDPCQLDFWVYIETLVPAFAVLWFTLSVPFLDDILRDNAYRKLANRRGGSLRGMSHGRLAFRGGKEPAVNRYTDRGLRTLLRLTEPLEKLGFVVLVFFAVDRFYMDWSALLDNRICNPFDRGSGFSCRDGPGSDLPNPGGGAIGMTASNEDWGGGHAGVFGGSVPNGRYFVNCAVNYDGDNPSTPAPFKLRLSIPGNLGAGTFDGPEVMIGGGQGGSLMVTANVFLPLLTGSSITWSVVGPAVPTGLNHSSASALCSQVS